MCWIWSCDNEHEEKKSKAVGVIFENMYDIKYWIESTLKDSIEDQEKVCLAFLQKLGSKKTIEEAAKFVLDMKSKIAIKKIENQKKDLGDDEAMDSDVFADLTITIEADDTENKKED